jgi:hypothetical protein
MHYIAGSLRKNNSIIKVCGHKNSILRSSKKDKAVAAATAAITAILNVSSSIKSEGTNKQKEMISLAHPLARGIIHCVSAEQ